MGLYSQNPFCSHQWAGVLHYARLQALAMDKHSTLLELVMCCECGPWGRVHNFFFMHINGLDLCIPQGSKGLPVTNTLAYWHIYKLWSVANTGPWTASTRHFCNFKWPRVLHYKRLENLASDKHSSFLGPSPRGMVCTNANCSNNQIH